MTDSRSSRSAKNLLAVLLLAALPISAQEFAPEQVVFPITGFKPDIRYLAPFIMKFGTGFCLDPDCRFVGTNYHVAKIMGTFVRIKGVFSAHRYLDSNADDADAERVDFAENAGSLRYTLVHDLAIYEMRRPLKRYHGTGFDAEEPKDDTQVDIYAYPFNWNPKRGLVHWQGNIVGKTTQGLLAFKYSDGQIHGGASGGIVVDSKTKKIVGILSGIARGEGRIALAVPTAELAEFVARAQPYLQAILFPKTVFVSPVGSDLYPPFIPLGREEDSAATLKLRATAQRLADSMRNFSATETFAWGEENRQPELSDAYETLIVDGLQRWRRPGSQRFYDNVPFPRLSNWITSGDEWSWLPELLGVELNLNIHQAHDAIIGGRKIHVFQYDATAADKVCRFRRYYPGLWGSENFYACHGEVWLDESGIILRISQTIDLAGPWHRWWGVMTYGWLKKDGRLYLVPVTIATQAEHQKTYWCRGLFTDYEMFDVKSRVVTAAK